ncbi:hypothetical protein [Nonomuraea jabiensis]|uniref:hypothetical protein n=1 Tax=Nonomuraea jabiensis TaxID=882448 RepID=UPI003D73EFDC
MLYATTTDFRLFSEPKIWHDPGHAVIDSAVIKHNGVYYRYTKDERDQTPSVPSAKLITAEKSRELTSTTYDFVADRIGDGDIDRGEGPAVFKSNTKALDELPTAPWSQARLGAPPHPGGVRPAAECLRRPRERFLITHDQPRSSPPHCHAPVMVALGFRADKAWAHHVHPTRPFMASSRTGHGAFGLAVSRCAAAIRAPSLTSRCR